jgi:DNA mismatch repair protein MutS2
LQKGARVFVARLRADAEVLEVLASGQVRVAAGALKLLVEARELSAARSTREEGVASKPSAKGSKAARGTVSGGAARIYVRTTETTCDLRGMRTDDAIVFASSFVDRLMQRGDDAGFLLHGHGTGALKEALRRELSRAQHVRLVRPAEQDEGGDAFTVVVLH